MKPESEVGNLPRSLFGTSGIRGSVDNFLICELLENKGTMLVGRDVRMSSHMIQNAVMSGFSPGEINTADCGILPTPTMLFALKKLQATAGVMVTGSHTPPTNEWAVILLGRYG